MKDPREPLIFMYVGLSIGILNILLAILFFAFNVGTPLGVMSLLLGVACAALSLYKINHNENT